MKGYMATKVKTMQLMEVETSQAWQHTKQLASQASLYPYWLATSKARDFPRALWVHLAHDTITNLEHQTRLCIKRPIMLATKIQFYSILEEIKILDTIGIFSRFPSISIDFHRFPSISIDLYRFWSILVNVKRIKFSARKFKCFHDRGFFFNFETEVDIRQDVAREKKILSAQINYHSTFFVVPTGRETRKKLPPAFWPVKSTELEVKEQSPHLESAKGKKKVSLSGGVYRANHDPLFMYLLLVSERPKPHVI